MSSRVKMALFFLTQKDWSLRQDILKKLQCKLIVYKNSVLRLFL